MKHRRQIIVATSCAAVLLSAAIGEARPTLIAPSSARAPVNATNPSDRSNPKKKGMPRFPNVLGRRKTNSIEDTSGKVTDAPSDKGDGDRDGGTTSDDDAQSPPQDSSGKATGEEEDEPKSKPAEEKEASENVVETTNKTSTRPSILFMPSTPQQGRHLSYPPHPFYNSPPPQPQRKKPQSLLSSILSGFFPPSNIPPPSPYGPPMPPNPYAPSHQNTNSNEVTILFSTILSLVLRLAIVSLTTHVLDLFGLGSHSDGSAFIPSPAQHYTFERVNDRYRRDGSALMQALSSPPPGVGKNRWKRIFGRRRRDNVKTIMWVEEQDAIANMTITQSSETASLDNGELYNKTVIIVDLKPDSRVGNGMAEHLRDTVSFLIEQHRDHVDKRRNLHKYASLDKNSSQLRTTKGVRPAMGTDLEILLLLDSPGGTVQDYGLASSHLARLRNEPHITLSVCVDRVAASGG
jgi:hypothetical protein